MRLLLEESRCVCRGEIHELVTTDEGLHEPGATIDRVGFLGFVEIERGGVIERGDVLCLGNGRVIGSVIGFDASHFPNHYNILVLTDSLVTATDLSLSVKQRLIFHELEGRQ